MNSLVLKGSLLLLSLLLIILILVLQTRKLRPERSQPLTRNSQDASLGLPDLAQAPWTSPWYALPSTVVTVLGGEYWALRRKWLMGWMGLGRCKDEEEMMLEGRFEVLFLFPNEAPMILCWQPVPPPTTYTSTKEYSHTDISHTTVGSASGEVSSSCTSVAWLGQILFFLGPHIALVYNEEVAIDERGNPLSDWEEVCNLKAY